MPRQDFPSPTVARLLDALIEHDLDIIKTADYVIHWGRKAATLRDCASNPQSEPDMAPEGDNTNRS